MNVEWSVSVYARNESATLAHCLRNIVRAVGERQAHITVMLNGVTDDSCEVAAAAARSSPVPIAIYAIAFGDKANALNQFIHRVRPEADVYFFVDGYAMVDPAAFAELEKCLKEYPAANGAAAVPSTGRSAAALRTRMLAEGGIHGSLFALRGRFLDRLTAKGLKLPIGLYYGDGYLNSLASHDLDSSSPWRPSLVPAAIRATWTMRPLSPFRWQDLKRQWNRMIRVRRGRFETAAIKKVIYPGGFQAMPAFSSTLLLDWFSANPERRPSLWRDPFGWLATRQLRHPTLPKDDILLPRLLGSKPGS
jgi:hypothetical protein